jgi:hypothetical protein
MNSEITQQDNGTWSVTTGPMTTTFADDAAFAAVQVGRLQQEILRLRGDYAKLHGVVESYINAPAQVRGEAYRDLQGTMDHLAGRNDGLGWAACWQKQQAEIERLQAIVDRLPKTADGVPVIVAEIPTLWVFCRRRGLYRPNEGEVLCEFYVDELVDGDFCGMVEGSHRGRYPAAGCYSTCEAAEQARQMELIPEGER